MFDERFQHVGRAEAGLKHARRPVRAEPDQLRGQAGGVEHRCDHEGAVIRTDPEHQPIVPASNTRLPCVCMAPLGYPVVPEV